VLQFCTPVAVAAVTSAAALLFNLPPSPDVAALLRPVIDWRTRGSARRQQVPGLPD